MSTKSLKKLALSKYTDFNPVSIKRKLIGTATLFWRYFKGPGSWWFIAILTLCLYSLCIFDLPIPVIFSLTRIESFELLNKRLSDYVTLFSLSIAVSVFIVSAMQSKRIGEEQISTVFIESFLYPILYFILINVAVVAFVSFTKDTKILEGDVVARIAVLFLWFFVISLIFIAFLFHRVFRFLSTKHLQIKFVENFIWSFDDSLKQELLSRISHVEFVNIYKESLGKPVIPLKNNLTMEDVIIKSSKNKIIRIDDINLKKLFKLIDFLNVQKVDYLLRPIRIGLIVNKDIGIAKVDRKLIEQVQPMINNLFRFGIYDTTEFDNSSELLKATLMKTIREDDTKSFESLLEVYFKAFEKFANSTHQMESSNYMLKLKPLELFDFEFGVLKNINEVLRNSVTEIVQLNHIEQFRISLSFIIRVYSLCIRTGTSELFLNHMHLPTNLYSITANTQQFRKMLFDDFFLRIREMVRFQLLEKILNSSEETTALIYCYKHFMMFLEQFSEIMYSEIKAKDYELLEKTLDLHLQLRNEINRANVSKSKAVYDKVNKLYIYSIFGILAWLIRAFKENQIDEGHLIKLSDKITSTISISTQESLDMLSEFLFKDVTYFNWRNWGNEELRTKSIYTGEAFQPVVPNNWLPRALLLLLIRNNSLRKDSIKSLKADDKNSLLFDSMKVYCDELLSAKEFSKWSRFANLKEESAFKEKVNEVLKAFEHLSQSYEKIQC